VPKAKVYQPTPTAANTQTHTPAPEEQDATNNENTESSESKVENEIKFGTKEAENMNEEETTEMQIVEEYCAKEDYLSIRLTNLCAPTKNQSKNIKQSKTKTEQRKSKT
jgi:hypothetical protein